jgi:hypothetical protein
MFTAIVTAMIGLFWLSVLGIVDLSLVYVGNTYLLPQIVGGLILGIGFVVGGYCPGTSCVGAATGRYDAMLYLLGIIAGIVVFGEMYPLVKEFYASTAMGKVTLPELFGVSYGLIVFLVVLMALGGFAGAEWVEKKFASKGVRQ